MDVQGGGNQDSGGGGRESADGAGRGQQGPPQDVPLQGRDNPDSSSGGGRESGDGARREQKDPLGVQDVPPQFRERTDYQLGNEFVLDKFIMTGSAGEIDQKEETFQQIKLLKDAYFSKLMEIDQNFVVPDLTEGQSSSLSGEEAEQFNQRAGTKKMIRETLTVLQMEKSYVDEGLKEKLPEYKLFIENLLSGDGKSKALDAKMNKGYESRNCWEQPQMVNLTCTEALFPGAKSGPQQQQEQPGDVSLSFPINLPEDQVRCEGAETLVAKNPFDNLYDALRTSSSAALRSSVDSMCSVIWGSDIVPHGETLLQQPAGSSSLNKFGHISLPESSPAGSMGGCCMGFEDGASNSESSRERSVKRQKIQGANYALLKEIEGINNTLIDTGISIIGDTGTGGVTSYCDADTTIKLSYRAVSLSADLKLLFEASQMSLDMTMKLCVPADYPRSPPKLIDDNGDDQLRAKAAFRRALRDLQEPWSIKEIARAWDTSVRSAVTEFAHQNGGGTFSSRFGKWERLDG